MHSLRIPTSEQKRILKTVHENHNDCELVCSLLITLARQQHACNNNVAPAHIMDMNHDQYFVLRICNGIQAIADTQLAELRNMYPRLIGVRILFQRRQIHLRLAKIGSVVARTPFCPLDAELRKRPKHAFNWRDSRVTDADDQSDLAALVDEVYNYQQLIPSVGMWVEHVASSSDCASESDATLPEEVHVGYALCFHNLPDMSDAFFEYMRAKSTVVRIAALFTWLPREPPILMIIARRSKVSVQQCASAAAHFVPAGGVVVYQEPRKKRSRD